MATIAENIQTLRSIKSDIKNAIIQKGGSVTDAFGTYAQAITNLPSGGGGGTEIEDALITRTLSEYSNDRISKVGNYAFANYFPLKNVNLPKVASVNDYAFYYCTALLSVDLPKCSEVRNYAFYHCPLLQSIDLPLCTFLGNNAFGYCSALSIANIPLCNNIGNYGFTGCSNLTQVYLNSVSIVTYIEQKTFNACRNLTSVYVPSSLVDAFKTAPNWSSISDKIVAYTGA